MKRIILTAAMAIAVCAGAMAQGFQGSIYFTRTTGKEVIKYAYHVAGDKVRIDEMEEGTGKLTGSMIVDLKLEKVFALSHERHLYMEPVKKDAAVVPAGTEVKKGDLERVIRDKRCQQYRVKNTANNTEINYWVTEGDYSFFPRLLKVLGRKDNLATYYMALGNLDKQFPMMGNEYTLLREERGYVQVDRMEEKKLDPKMFVIPENYAEVDH
jgi:hypothetical protein